MQPPLIGITMGDAAGIGPEIILKALSLPQTYELCRPLVFGDPDFLRKQAHKFNLEVKFVPTENPLDLPSGRAGIWPVLAPPLDSIQPGTPSAITGQAAVACIRQAVELALQGVIQAVTTAPISKQAIQQAGWAYPGHTELLAQLTGAKDYAMLLAGGGLRVVLLTIHRPLREIFVRIESGAILHILGLIQRSLPALGIERPRIAVAGLNPHAGEGGVLGDEEERIIRPAVEAACAEGIEVFGPYPPDSLFLRAAQGEFDVVLAMYHDQGAIPLKLLAGRAAVNVTLGLPVLRTSVGHGCAFDIAGQGVADPRSLIEALKVASLRRV